MIRSLVVLFALAALAAATPQNVTTKGPSCSLDGACSNCAWCVSNGGKFCRQFLGNPWCWGASTTDPKCDSGTATTNCDVYNDCSSPVPIKANCRISNPSTCWNTFRGVAWCSQLNGWPTCLAGPFSPNMTCDPGTPAPAQYFCATQLTTGGVACDSCQGCAAMYGRYCQDQNGKRWCWPAIGDATCTQGSPQPTSQCDSLCCAGTIPPAGCSCSSCQGCQLLNGNYCQQGANGTSQCLRRPTTARCASGDWPRPECGCTANTKMVCAKPISNCPTSCRSGGSASECQTCMAGYYNMCCPCLQQLGHRVNCN